MIYKPGFVIQICRTLLENDCIENALKSFLSNVVSIVSEQTVLRIIIFDVTRSDLSRALWNSRNFPNSVRNALLKTYLLEFIAYFIYAIFAFRWKATNINATSSIVWFHFHVITAAKII